MGVFDTTQDVFDSREIVAAIYDLENDIETMEYDIETMESEHACFERDEQTERDIITMKIDNLKDEIENVKNELEPFTTLRDEVEENNSEWSAGITFVKDDIFEEYAEDEARNSGAITGDSTVWPLSCIDWERAAKEFQFDFSEIDIEGVQYWYRNS